MYVKVGLLAKNSESVQTSPWLILWSDPGIMPLSTIRVHISAHSPSSSTRVSKTGWKKHKFSR